MPRHVVRSVADALNEVGRAVRGSRILLLGLAYKKNVDDDRESPTYAIWEMLAAAGAEVSYNDPFVPTVRAGRTHGAFAGSKSVRITDEFDAIVVCTDHDAYASQDFTDYRATMIDTRNVITKRPLRYHKA
jgi:UDP-N-acetyl-D-glucosamine dehydrogenase